MIRRLRRRNEHRTVRDTSRPRSEIRRAVELIAFLADNDIALADWTHADIERFLTAGGKRNEVHAFVAWAHRRGISAHLDIPRREQGWPTRTLDPERHQLIIDRLLDDDSISAADRTAGLFVACYGQIPARIVRLSNDDVDATGDKVRVRFGRDQITLPEPLADLMRTMLGERRGRAATDRRGQSRWMFPGGIPGQPLGPNALCLRLHRIGVDALTVRTAAMLDLAAEVPPSIIADVIGVHDNVAARWVRAAGGDWAAYVASRARHATPATT